jgi:hypothetical protein
MRSSLHTNPVEVSVRPEGLDIPDEFQLYIKPDACVDVDILLGGDKLPDWENLGSYRWN